MSKKAGTSDLLFFLSFLMNGTEMGGTAADFEAGDYTAVFLLALFIRKCKKEKEQVASTYSFWHWFSYRREAKAPRIITEIRNISPNTPIYIKCLSLNPMSSSIFIFSPFNFSIRSCNCQRIKPDWLESGLNFQNLHLLCTN